MHSRITRPLVALCLSALMLLGAVGTASGSDSASGFIPCGRDSTVTVHSEATGTVEHYSDGKRIGWWSNGSTVTYRSAIAVGKQTQWEVHTTGAIESAWATCQSH